MNKLKKMIINILCEVGKFNNIIITVILAFYMIAIDPIISDLFVIPMFVTLLLYIYWIKKEDVLWNIFLLLFSYMLVVILDNLIHFTWVMAGVEPADHYLTYIICSMIEFPIFFMICGWISKTVREKKGNSVSVA